jgi:PPOX class probable FMN-dependent enzyme
MTDRPTPPFRDVIADETALRALMGTPSDLARKKQVSGLDQNCRDLIARSPFLLLGTSNAAGQCDVSPKGDAPGFVQVLDERRMVIPDRPGNKRFDGMRNILANPHVGVLFLVPGVGETLRVNGRAWITRDGELLDRLVAKGKRPELAIGIEVEEVFLHCAKAFKRSELWEPERWPSLEGLVCSAQIFLDHAKPEGMTVEDVQKRLDTGYRTTLY